MATFNLTTKQYAMLVVVNGCSLPGDGLRIKGSGQHRSARLLEDRGLVRVYAPSDGRKARVHITPEGRRFREQMAAKLLGAGGT
jgi:DNA-binding MarR family transcriptional regulator